jgi:hypothetical protein
MEVTKLHKKMHIAMFQSKYNSKLILKYKHSEAHFLFTLAVIYADIAKIKKTVYYNHANWIRHMLW